MAEKFRASPSQQSLGNTRSPSPAASFSYQLPSQDEHMNDPAIKHQDHVNPVSLAVKKVKRTRLLLDARTELTDDELKVR